VDLAVVDLHITILVEQLLAEQVHQDKDLLAVTVQALPIAALLAQVVVVLVQLAAMELMAQVVQVVQAQQPQY
jgi:hypothetical protein